MKNDHTATTKHALHLNHDQLHEVYNAMWREFVALHDTATINRHGLAKAVIERVRHSRTAAGQVCDMIESIWPELATTDDRYRAARAQAKIEADHGVIFAATRNGTSFVMPEFPDAGKRYDLSKIAPFAIPVPASFGSRPRNDALEIAELAVGLHGKDFAMLTEDELKRFRLIRDEGRKFGLIVTVEIIHGDDIIQAELAAASRHQQEEIYRSVRTEISVRWAVIDSQPSSEADSTDSDFMSKFSFEESGPMLTEFFITLFAEKCGKAPTKVQCDEIKNAIKITDQFPPTHRTLNNFITLLRDPDVIYACSNATEEIQP